MAVALFRPSVSAEIGRFVGKLRPICRNRGAPGRHSAKRGSLARFRNAPGGREVNRWTVSVNYRSAAGDSRKLPANSTLGRFHYRLVTEVGREERGGVGGGRGEEGKRKKGRKRKRGGEEEADPGRRGRHFGQIANGGTVAGAGEQPGFAAPWLLRPIIRTNLIICLSSSPRPPCRPPRSRPIKSGQVATKSSIFAQSGAGQMSRAP